MEAVDWEVGAVLVHQVECVGVEVVMWWVRREWEVLLEVGVIVDWV